MGRKEARVERRLQREVDQKRKSARLVEAVQVAQIPRVAEGVYTSSAPRVAADPLSYMQMNMEYRLLEKADRKDSWSWGQHRDWCAPGRQGDAHCEIKSTMIYMSALRWHEIHSQMTGGGERHRKHHSQSFDSLCDEAQARWIEIDRTEDELFRFRCGGRQRIWGFREGHVFFVVWWDPEHQIYPVD